jgi:hypothetical protein
VIQTNPIALLGIGMVERVRCFRLEISAHPVTMIAKESQASAFVMPGLEPGIHVFR